LIADLSTWSLAIHAPLCGFAWLGVFKCGGESKFGKQTQEEIKEARSEVLRLLSASLVEKLQPLLSLADTVDVPRLFVVGDDTRTPPTITPIGSEKLLNAVRDYVKSDAKSMLALRKLDSIDFCITKHLKWLRLTLFAVAFASGFFALFASTIKAEMFPFPWSWPFVAAFASVAILTLLAAYHALRVVLAVNSFEGLKETHDNFS